MNYWYRANDTGLYNDTHSIIRFNAMTRLFSFGYYNVHTVFMCFISLLGLTAFYKVFINELNNNKKEVFAVVFLLPSMLFWGSGVLKDGLFIFTFGVSFYFFIKILRSDIFNLKFLFLFIFFISLVSITKPYVFMAILPGLFGYFWVLRINKKYMAFKFFVLHLIFFMIVFNIHYLFEGYNLPEILHRKQMEFFDLAKETKPGSFVQISAIEPNFISVVKNAPGAIGHTFFNPGIFNARSPIILLSVLENLLIIIAVILSILSINGAKPMLPIFYFSIYFFLILFALIGMVTPILGALVRYKAIGSMFLLIGLLSIYDKKLLLNRFNLFCQKCKF